MKRFPLNCKWPRDPPPTRTRAHTRAYTHTHPLSRLPCAMQNSGEEARPPAGWRVRAGKEPAQGQGRLPRSSPTDMNGTAPSQAFHFGSRYQVLGARGQRAAHPSQARSHFCAHPQAAVTVPIRSPYTSPRGVHTCTAPGAQPRVPANTGTVVHACTGARPSSRALREPGEVGANSRRPRRSSEELRGVRSRSAPWCSSRASLLVLPLPLSLSLPSFSRSPFGRVFLLPSRRSPGLPLGRTCSRRRSRMQWGALRARASRPPQQPPGLAGSRMLRPPRAPLAVPRCPHRPHGGRLSKPEALQQGSTGAEKRWRGRVSPLAGGGRVGGRLQSAVLTAPLCAQGARLERGS